MRVLYTFPRVFGNVGIGTTALNQVLGLTALGHQVEVWAKSASVWPSGVRVRETFGPRRRLSNYVLRNWTVEAHDAVVATHLSAVDDAFDIIHGWPAGSRWTFEIARRKQLRTVLELPNTHIDNQIAVAQRLKRFEEPAGRRERQRHRILREYDLADALLAPSDAVAATFPLHAGKVRRHRYGCDVASLQPTGDDARDEDHSLVAAIVGLQARKGVHTALEAWRKASVQGGRIVLAGSWAPGYRSAVAHLLDDSVVEVGRTTDVARLLRAVDVLVLSSYEEGSALTTYEAQAAGALCLTTPQAGAWAAHPVAVQHHAVEDVAGLARQLRDAAEDPRRLRDVRRCVRQRSASLSWDAAAAALVNAYTAA